MRIVMELSIYSGSIIDSEQIVSLSDVIHHNIKIHVSYCDH